MYAIAYKISPRSSWYMYSQVFEDREKCDIAVSAMKDGKILLIGKIAKAQRVFFEEDI